MISSEKRPNPVVLHCCDVNLDYPTSRGALPVLERFSLEVRSGEFVVIVGPSGCGKSSLLRMFLGLESATRGQVEVFAERPSLVFQDGGLFPWLTILDNAAFGLESLGSPSGERRSKALAVLAELGLEAYSEAFPFQISAGMAQRVALARSLAAESDLFLLDEPFSALDAITRAQLQQLLKSFRRSGGATILMVTHDVDEALLLGDRVLVLSQRPARVIGTYFPEPANAAHQSMLREKILGGLGVSPVFRSAVV